MSIIYHYCSTETLQKIIEGKTLRFSDITKSNDSKETIWILDFIMSALTKEYEKQSEAFKRKCSLDRIIKRKTSYFIDRYWGEYSLYTYFVLCFAGEGDSLNMWKMYADDGKGVAIGFDNSYFKELSGSLDCIQYKSVDYADIDNTDLLSEETKSLFEKLNSCVNEGEKIDYYNAPYDKYIKDLFLKAVFCKHPGFQDEKESRSCIHWNLGHSNPTGINLFYKKLKIAQVELGKETKGSNIRLYLDARFEAGFFSEMLFKIIIGPKCQWTVKDISALLVLNGIDKPIFDNIEYSTIPFI